MNEHRDQDLYNRSASDRRPILLVPYMWIGDFVRCHSVVRVLNARFPDRPVDVLATPLTAPLTDYMPGVRKAVIAELPRGRLALAQQWRLAAALKHEDYGDALVMPRTWKSALLPWLAGIAQRTGFVGEARLLLLNDLRWGERRLERMVERCVALALPRGAPLPDPIPPPRLAVNAADVAAWRAAHGVDPRRQAVALAPGSVGSSKRWTVEGYGAVAAGLDRQGVAVWVLGGPGEKDLAAEIVRRSGGSVRDLTGHDLRNAVLGLAAAQAAVSNDSGLMHVSAALGTPTHGIFGPTDPWLWGPLNPLAAAIETQTDVPCRPCHLPVCPLLHHRCMRDIPADAVLAALARTLARADLALANRA